MLTSKGPRQLLGVSVALAPVVIAVALSGCGGGTPSDTSTTSGTGGGTTTSSGHGGAGGVTGSGGSGGVTGSGGSACTAGATMPCYSGPDGTLGVGICVAGFATCAGDGSAWGPCEGDVTPQPETCNTPDDDDCNGQTNEGGAGCVCVPGSTASCYTGPSGTEGVGACAAGIQTCDAQGKSYGPCLGEATPLPEESCLTPQDDNCDGQTNEGCVCAPNSTASCYSGPTGTEGQGACHAGTRTCNALGTAYGPCTGQVTPSPELCTTPQDDNCDGQANEGCVCTPNSTSSCYSGPPGSEGLGACHPGTHTCNAEGTGYGACSGEVTPVDESCATPGDDNCDGVLNEGCICAPHSTSSCYSGPAGTQGVGVCQPGTHTCNAEGTGYGPCTGEVTPQPETCLDTLDNDCNGQINEGGAGCVCLPYSTASCYSGPAGSQGVGACKAGSKTCNAQGTALGPCVGEVTPQAEVCATSLDEDCDGQVDEGCLCTPNSTSSCYSGPTGTQGVGVCHAGMHTCNAEGTGYGPCTGEVTPQPETCLDTLDNDCNGQTNESGIGCVCLPNSASSCYSGPAGTLGVGPCHAGTQTCNALGTEHGPCTGEVTPQPETCLDTLDNDCNGQTNEGGTGCVCTPNSTSSCYTGPSGTSGVGACLPGTHVCNGLGTGYEPCIGEVTPAEETCHDTVDADCTGVVNDSCGKLLWSIVPGTQLDDEGYAVTVDAAGNIILGGYFTASVDVGCGPLTPPTPTGETGLVWKATPSGACLWARGFGEGTSVAHVATDAAGNVFVAGGFQTKIDFPGITLTSLGVQNIYLAKYDTHGTFQWAKRYGDDHLQAPGGLAVDSQGNILLTGSYMGTIDFGGGPTTALRFDLFVVKLDNDGNHIWSKSFGEYARTQWGYGIAVDASDNVVVTGQLSGTINYGGAGLTAPGMLSNVFVAKFSPTGAHLWSQAFGDSSDQVGKAVVVGATGEIYVVGNYSGTLDFGNGPLPVGASAGGFLVKMSPSGDAIWSQGFWPVTAYSVAVDALGAVAFAGRITGPVSFGGEVFTNGGSSDGFIAKFTPAGTYLWSKQLGGPATDIVKCIAADQDRNWWVVGLIMGPMTLPEATLQSIGGEDLFVLKLSP